MDRFDSFLTQLYNTHNIEEAGEDLPMPPTGAETGGGAAPGAPGVPQPGAAAPAAAANPEPIAPEDNIDDNNEEQSALIPGKKIQLIKLITRSFISNGLFSSSADSHTRGEELRTIRTALNNPTTIGNVEDTEKHIIRAIAKLQNIEPFEVAKNIGYVTSSANKEASSKYISNTEYSQLIELARKALISDPNKTGNNDKFGIIDVEDITSANAEETLSKLKTILGGEVV